MIRPSNQNTHTPLLSPVTDSVCSEMRVAVKKDREEAGQLAFFAAVSSRTCGRVSNQRTAGDAFIKRLRSGDSEAV
jgi:hypothetical protein